MHTDQELERDRGAHPVQRHERAEALDVARPFDVRRLGWELDRCPCLPVLWLPYPGHPAGGGGRDDVAGKGEAEQ